MAKESTEFTLGIVPLQISLNNRYLLLLLKV